MKVQANQILAYDKLSFSNSLGESDNLAYNIGKLAKVAVLNTDDNFEDSGIITESLSKSLATPIVLKEDRVLEKDAYVIVILIEFAQWHEFLAKQQVLFIRGSSMICHF